MDIKLAKPFIEATVNVLSTMAMINPKAEKPYIKDNNRAFGDVSGIVGFTAQGGKKGVMSVSFSKKCAVQIVKNLLGDDIENIVEDVQDAVGEITNMISGQARAKLADMGIAMEGATPTVIMGENHTITHITKNKIMAVPFTTEHGDFVVEFSMSD
ncbi:chemotaxis protein CheX [Desulfothermus okinawensis JCM 13304]